MMNAAYTLTVQPLCFRWSAQLTANWTQTTRWQPTPTPRSQCRRRWKWWMRLSTWWSRAFQRPCTTPLCIRSALMLIDRLSIVQYGSKEADRCFVLITNEVYQYSLNAPLIRPLFRSAYRTKDFSCDINLATFLFCQCFDVLNRCPSLITDADLKVSSNTGCVQLKAWNKTCQGFYGCHSI